MGMLNTLGDAVKNRWDNFLTKKLTTAVWVKILSKAAHNGAIFDLAPNADNKTLAASFGDNQVAGIPIPAEALRKVLLDTKIHADPRGFILRGATIEGLLDLRYATLSYPLSLISCFISDGINLSNANIYSLNLSGSSCGLVDLQEARVDGSVVGQGATIKGGMRAPGVRISGQLNLEGAKLTNPKGAALFLDAADVSRDVVAERLTAEGGIHAFGSRITGTLILNEANLINPNGFALLLDGAKIDGGVMAEKLTAKGAVQAPVARITGPLMLQEASLFNPSGLALGLDAAEISGGVVAEKLTAEGEVRAPASRIFGQILLLEANLINPNGFALFLDGAEVTGNIMAIKLTAEGEVRAVGSRITGQFAIVDTSLTNTKEAALNLASTSIDTLVLKENIHINGDINLKRAHIENFLTDEHCPPKSSLGTLCATGWILRDIHGWLRNEPQAAEQWLLSSSKASEFSPQPWHELANVYDRIGHTTAARRMRYKATQQTNSRQPWWVRITQFFYKALVGYGYYPLRTIGWFTGAFIIALTLVTANMNSFAPTNPVAAQNAYIAVNGTETEGEPNTLITGATPCENLGNRYSCLRPWSYAATTVTPASALQTPAWAPSASWLEAVLMSLKFSGWILTAFLLAGLTGLLRKA